MHDVCPICEFNIGLNELDICSNCGFQLGYNDSLLTIEELKELYELDGECFWREFE